MLRTHDGDLHVWDLPLLCRQLAAMGVDTNLPTGPGPITPATPPTPMRFDVRLK